MKKILLCLFFMFMCILEVDAACAYGANVNGEFICLVSGATTANKSGTAYPENGVLVLENYNGGSIGYSSGLGNPLGSITIKLVGDNYINADDSYGLRVPLSGVEFVGDGTLTIKSKLPFAVVDMDNLDAEVVLGSNVSTIKVLAGSKVNENNTVVDNNEDEEVNDCLKEVNLREESKINKFDFSSVLVIVCCVISVICLLIVFLVNKKEKK